MKLPSLKRLQEQDYPKKYYDLISNIFYILNSFMQNVTSVINGNLTYSDNFDMVDVTLEIQAPITNLKVKNSKGINMRGLHLANVTPLSNPTEVLSGTPFVSWFNSSDNQITIQYITNLTPGNKYSIRMLWFT